MPVLDLSCTKKNPKGRHFNSYQHELSERLVVTGHVTLSLENIDLDLGLTVGSSGEGLEQ